MLVIIRFGNVLFALAVANSTATILRLIIILAQHPKGSES